MHLHFHAFSGWGTSQSQKSFQKAFSTENIDRMLTQLDHYLNILAETNLLNQPLRPSYYIATI